MPGNQPITPQLMSRTFRGINASSTKMGVEPFFVIANNGEYDAFETDSTLSNLGELGDFKKQIGWK